jgi:predicted RNA-binding Zn ribbon-like protein
VESDAVSLLGTDRTSRVYGGRLCLAFVNSVWWRRSDAPEEQLTGYPELVEFVATAGWLPQAGELVRLASEHADEAARALRRALELRQQLLAVFAAWAAGDRPPDAALRVVERFGAAGMSGLRLEPSDAGYLLRWTATSLDLPAQQAAVSAMLLLAGPEVARVKQCPGTTCGWVFLDVTRNRSRRWCNSAECGNRSRVQAHYARTKAAAQ